MTKPFRKRIRLQNYDYNNSGIYFITFNTYQNQYLFGHPSKPNTARDIISTTIYNYFHSHHNIHLIHSVVMPNHVHLLIQMDKDNQTPITKYIQQLKSLTTNAYIKGFRAGELPLFHEKVWQRSFHDRVVRDEKEFEMVWTYIDNNPKKWELDKYYVERD